jgi:hypothetical protein
MEARVAAERGGLFFVRQEDRVGPSGGPYPYARTLSGFYIGDEKVKLT